MAAVDGFIAYAPELAHEGGGFDATYFPVLVGLEEANFWFRARNELILWALEKYCKGFGWCRAPVPRCCSERQ
jgi:hypothetical protein